MKSSRNGRITATPQPAKPESMQVTYETVDSRRTIDLPAPRRPKRGNEAPPHGAGSYHDPEQHRILLDRVDALLRKKQG